MSLKRWQSNFSFGCNEQWREACEHLHFLYVTDQTSIRKTGSYFRCRGSLAGKDPFIICTSETHLFSTQNEQYLFLLNQMYKSVYIKRSYVNSDSEGLRCCAGPSSFQSSGRGPVLEGKKERPTVRYNVDTH